MGHHNVLITNPQGERRHQFEENVSMQECRDWMNQFKPAPKGWLFQIVNLGKKPRVYPDHIIIRGFKYNEQGGMVHVEDRKARILYNNGRWYTPRMAKRDARAQGAVQFTRIKVWAE